MRKASPIAVAVLGFSAAGAYGAENFAGLSTARYLDSSDGRDWPGYGSTFGQQHYSPLGQINEKNIRDLGFAWSCSSAAAAVFAFVRRYIPRRPA